MKKSKYLWLVCAILPCAFIMTACGVKSTYISPTVNLNEITVSNIEAATNKAAMSVVSLYVEGRTFQGSVYGAGSGVIYKLDKEAGDAYIITNYHVVYDEDFRSTGHIASKITAEIYGSEGTSVVSEYDGSVTITYGEQAIDCQYVGGSLKYDLALLKISGSDLIKKSDVRAAEIASEPAHLGQTVIAVGNPLGYHISATKGIVSLESEYIRYSDFHDVTVRSMRIDAPINGGNSGGGAFDEKGRLIGIVNAGIDDAENVGSAIPAKLATNVIDNIMYGIQSGRYSGLKEFDLGIMPTSQNSIAVFEEELGLSFIKEDIIAFSVSGKAAEVGIKSGDKIVSAIYNGNATEFSRVFEFEEFLLTLRPGTSFTLKVVRQSGIKEFVINV